MVRVKGGYGLHYKGPLINYGMMAGKHGKSINVGPHLGRYLIVLDLPLGFKIFSHVSLNYLLVTVYV